MAKLGAASGLASMKSGEEDEIAKLIAGRRAKAAAAKPDSAKLAREKNMEAIYANPKRLDSMVKANQSSWTKHVMDIDATSKIIKKN